MQIAQALRAIVLAIKVGRDIYMTIVEAMDAAQSETQSGADKKAWVLAFIRAWIGESKYKWEEWERAIITFIDFAKAQYNIVR